MQREQRNAAGSLGENDIARLDLAKLHDGAPCRQCSARQGGSFRIAQMIWSGDQRVLRESPVFRQHTVDRSAQGAAKLVRSRRAAVPALEEAAYHPVARLERTYSRTHRLNRAGAIGQGNERMFLTRSITSLDGENIPIVQCDGSDPDQDLAGTCRRHGLLDKAQPANARCLL